MTPEQPVTDPIEKTRLAPRYKVLIHNDNETTMGFVVAVLSSIFSLNGNAALQVMTEAHHKGIALVGVYAFEQAEFRVEQAHSIARTQGFPLTFTYEPE